MNEIVISNISELQTVSKTVAASGLFGAKTPEQAFVAIETGIELGLKPMQALRGITVINGKPTLNADTMLAIVMHHPEFVTIEWAKQDANEAECVITRKLRSGREVKTSGRFTMEDAKKAGLVRDKSPWVTYPARMLKARAQSFACRDAFPDVVNGIYSPDEAAESRQEFDALPERNITAEASAALGDGDAQTASPVSQAPAGQESREQSLAKAGGVQKVENAMDIF